MLIRFPRVSRAEPKRVLFQNVPNDFEATISVDEFGLVIYYPLLFEREQ